MRQKKDETGNPVPSFQGVLQLPLVAGPVSVPFYHGTVRDVRIFADIHTRTKLNIIADNSAITNGVVLANYRIGSNLNVNAFRFHRMPPT